MRVERGVRSSRRENHAQVARQVPAGPVGAEHGRETQVPKRVGDRNQPSRHSRHLRERRDQRNGRVGRPEKGRVGDPGHPRRVVRHGRRRVERRHRGRG